MPLNKMTSSEDVMTSLVPSNMSGPEEPSSLPQCSPRRDDENLLTPVLGTVQSGAVDPSSASAPDSLQSLSSNVSLNEATSSEDVMTLPAANV